MGLSEQIKMLESQRDRLLELAIEGTVQSQGGIAGGLVLARQLLADSTDSFKAGDGESFVLSRLAAIGMLSVVLEHRRREVAAAERN